MFDIITIVVLILSIVAHEVAHGYAANWLGDPTARLAGRLSPNPLLHIDPLGSVIIPALLFITQSPFLFGYAKPVPYNPYNLQKPKWGEAIVAAAGPLTNLFLALVFATIIRFAPVLGLSAEFMQMAWYVVLINVLLAIFNALPIPPLDGSKILPPFLPSSLSYRYQLFVRRMEALGAMPMFLILFILIFLFGPVFFHFIREVTNFLAFAPIF